MENKLDLKGYLRVMHDILLKKKKVLKEILEETKKQEAALNTEPVSDKDFMNSVDKKQELIRCITETDTGFQKIYDGIANELQEKKSEHADEIRLLRVLITENTELGVQISALEHKVKDKLDKKVKEVREGKKRLKINSQTASKYYKNMNNLNMIDPVFMDKKN